MKEMKEMLQKLTQSHMFKIGRILGVVNGVITFFTKAVMDDKISEKDAVKYGTKYVGEAILKEKDTSKYESDIDEFIKNYKEFMKDKNIEGYRADDGMQQFVMGQMEGVQTGLIVAAARLKIDDVINEQVAMEWLNDCINMMANEKLAEDEHFTETIDDIQNKIINKDEKIRKYYRKIESAVKPAIKEAASPSKKPTRSGMLYREMKEKGIEPEKAHTSKNKISEKSNFENDPMYRAGDVVSWNIKETDETGDISEKTFEDREDLLEHVVCDGDGDGDEEACEKESEDSVPMRRIEPEEIIDTEESDIDIEDEKENDESIELGDSMEPESTEPPVRVNGKENGYRFYPPSDIQDRFIRKFYVGPFVLAVARNPFTPGFRKDFYEMYVEDIENNNTSVPLSSTVFGGDRFSAYRNENYENKLIYIPEHKVQTFINAFVMDVIGTNGETVDFAESTAVISKTPDEEHEDEMEDEIKDEPEEATQVPDYVEGVRCPHCGSDKVVEEAGGYTCRDCWLNFSKNRPPKNEIEEYNAFIDTNKKEKITKYVIIPALVGVAAALIVLQFKK